MNFRGLGVAYGGKIGIRTLFLMGRYWSKPFVMGFLLWRKGHFRSVWVFVFDTFATLTVV